jgi:hypothetical protein
LALPFPRLSLAQQSVVHHGLGLKPAEWETFRSECASRVGAQRAVVESDAASPSAPAVVAPTDVSVGASTMLSPLASVARTVASKAWGAVQAAAPVITPLLQKSKHPALAFAGECQSCVCSGNGQLQCVHRFVSLSKSTRCLWWALSICALHTVALTPLLPQESS